MAKTILTAKMNKTDLAVAWSMMAGLAIALVQYGQALALPTHFV